VTRTKKNIFAEIMIVCHGQHDTLMLNIARVLHFNYL